MSKLSKHKNLHLSLGELISWRHYLFNFCLKKMPLGTTSDRFAIYLYFYRTRVRSLGMLVTNSLPN